MVNKEKSSLLFIHLKEEGVKTKHSKPFDQQAMLLVKSSKPKWAETS